MLNGDTDCIEKHKHNDKPVEPLSFNCVSNPKPKTNKQKGFDHIQIIQTLIN